MKRPFVPAFLNSFDRKLLLNKPSTWSARIHFVIYFSLLFILLVAALSFMAFTDARIYSDAAVWTSLTALLCFIGLIIWLVYLLRFNVFKRFGKQSTTAGLKTFLLFFLGMSFIVLPAFVPTLVESFRANRSFGSTEIVKDINTINKNILQLNYSILPKNFKADTVVQVANLDDVRYKNNAPAVDKGMTMAIEEITVVEAVKPMDYKIYLTPDDYAIKLKLADSSKIITDSMFVLYSSPVFAFIYNEDINRHASEKILSNIELYRNYVKNAPVIDINKINNELGVLLSKYKTAYNYSDYYVEENNNNYYETKIRDKYKLGNVNSSLYNISEKKYRWEMENFGTYFRVFFYCTFILSLLLFVFRHSTTRTFFLTLLTGVVLFILSAIIIAFGNWREHHVFTLMLIYFSIFAVLSFFIFSSKKRQIKQGIGLNMITVFMAFIPLMILALIDTQNSYYQRFEAMVNYKDYSAYYKYAEIGGVVLFLILLQPIIKKAYRKWYALPEN